VWGGSLWTNGIGGLTKILWGETGWGTLEGERPEVCHANEKASRKGKRRGHVRGKNRSRRDRGERGDGRGAIKHVRMYWDRGGT